MTDTSLVLDWSEDDFSSHRKIEILGAARPLLEVLGFVQDTLINPVFPLHGGTQVWTFERTQAGTYKVKALREGQMTSPIDYEAPQSLFVICKRPTAARQRKFNLDGRMNALEHAILLTALGGIPGGANLDTLGIHCKGPSRFKLLSMHHRSPLLTDLVTQKPMLGDSLTEVLFAARRMITIDAPRPDLLT